jgi:hypothetical protein
MIELGGGFFMNNSEGGDYPVDLNRQSKIDRYKKIKALLSKLNDKGIFLGQPKVQEVKPKVDLRPELYAKLDEKRQDGSGGSGSDSGSSNST